MVQQAVLNAYQEPRSHSKAKLVATRAAKDITSMNRGRQTVNHVSLGLMQPQKGNLNVTPAMPANTKIYQAKIPAKAASRIHIKTNRGKLAAFYVPLEHFKSYPGRLRVAHATGSVTPATDLRKPNVTHAKTCLMWW